MTGFQVPMFLFCPRRKAAGFPKEAQWFAELEGGGGGVPMSLFFPTAKSLKVPAQKKRHRSGLLSIPGVVGGWGVRLRGFQQKIRGLDLWLARGSLFGSREIP